MSILLFKLNQDHRYHSPKQTHRVMNWRAYDASPCQRGSPAVWLTAEGRLISVRIA